MIVYHKKISQKAKFRYKNKIFKIQKKMNIRVKNNKYKSLVNQLEISMRLSHKKISRIQGLLLKKNK